MRENSDHFIPLIARLRPRRSRNFHAPILNFTQNFTPLSVHLKLLQHSLAFLYSAAVRSPRFKLGNHA